MLCMLLSDREELYTVLEAKASSKLVPIYYSMVLFNTTYVMEFTPPFLLSNYSQLVCLRCLESILCISKTAGE